MNERQGTDINDSTEKTEMYETMNNVDNYSDYNEIHTNNTPTRKTTTSSKDTPKQSKEPITDEDETAKQLTTMNETSRPRRTKTTPRHLQNDIL